MAIATGIRLPTLPVETPEFSANPAPSLETARREHAWLASFSQGYIVHGHQAAADLLADDANLIPGYGGIVEYYDAKGTMWGRFFDGMMGAQSGAEHMRLRASVSRAFTPRHANQLRPLMRQVITRLLDEWAPKGEFDFALFASFFPVTVMCGILGISAEPIPRLRTALESQFAMLSLDPAAKPIFIGGFEELWSFAESLISDREANGAFDEDSLLDRLIAAKNAGQIDETEVRFLLIGILAAGFDTSKNMLTLMMKLLLDLPEIYTRCADDVEYCGKVLQEALRHSSIVTAYRTVARDFTYQGFPFQAGETLAFPSLLSGRDPLIFADPLRFDPERANAGRHVAFGRGAHICLGLFIARAQLQEGLHLIAQRIRSPRLNGTVAWRPFLGVWGLETLPIAFEPG